MERKIAGNRRVDRLLDEYGESHQDHKNKFIHWICVPVIVWTVSAFLWSIPTPTVFKSIPYLNWYTITMVLAIAYYITLSLTLAVGMSVITAACAYINAVYSAGLPLWQAALIVFVVAWIFQFVGHKIEGKKPSFFKDIQFLLIGPAWLLSFIYKRVGIPY
ncbi:Mpo1 family 2-hydroxy fatty acid dioxygenase [Flexibacterium corallicola]|uniref:Mpo1 family 2-hydroxy fatty acid dioxygenase n=1 Tax=Flexibacterium corallicola TaxID=3037259 RepID=UPI00286F61A0|nr:Mpo1-like protein [Pseudovibrio sp. M1P-2-3]